MASTLLWSRCCITSLSPTSGVVGSEVAITGTGFGTTQGSSTISLNGTTAPVASWSDTSIIANVPTGVSSGPFTVTVNGHAVNSPSFTVTTLPAGWLDGDIGSVGLSGSASFANGTFTVTGAGVGLSSTADAFHFVYQPLSGDGTIVARLASMQGPVTQAGVMIRETLDAGATFASEIYNGYFAYLMLYDRPTTGGSLSIQNGAYSTTLPYWMKLVRSGSTFTGYSSTDGVNWVQSGTSVTVNMAQNVYIGLMVSSTYTTTLATATFDGVSVSSTASPAPAITSVSATTGSIGSQVAISGTGFGAPQGGSLVTIKNVPMTVNMWTSTSIIATIPTAATSGPLLVSVAPSMNDSNAIDFTVTTQPLPTPWLDQDVGLVGAAGSASYANGVFTVAGSGQGISGSADQIHFVYLPLSGDGGIVARLASLQGSVAQAGVMIRETLDGAARSASDFYYAYYAYVMMYDRPTPGGTLASQFGVYSPTLPRWVRLVRTGSTFTGYASSDGVNWVQAGTSVTVSMAQNVYIGLMVSSTSTSTLATATFDNVAVTVGTTPFVTGVSPNLGGTGTAVTITGSNFGTTQGTSTASFNGTLASSITSWTSTQIVANVSAATQPGTGPVVVTVNSISSPSGVTFTMIKPVINSLTPPAAQPGGTVTLNGVGFGSSQGNSTVQFNSVTATATSWSDTSITVTVPPNATSGPVTVTEDGITSGGAQFTLLEAVSVTGVSPNVGPVGSTITIIGAGFGSTQSNSTANFYFATATNIVSWSDTQIVALVPAGALTGALNVQVGGITAYGPWFTLNTSVQVTDSLGNFSIYTAELIGGTWVPVNSEGSGCSSCTLRGAITYTYDNRGNVLTKTDELGHITSYTYDPNGNVASVTVPISAGVNATTQYTYNSFGEVLTATDPLGKVTTNTYDNNGNLLTVTTPAPNGSTAASVTTFTYDTKGELLTIKDPLNNVKTLTYYPTGLINTITDAQQNVTTYVYDTHGNRTSVTDAAQNQTTFDYWPGDRLKTITYPGSTGTTAFVYDYRGRRTSVTDQNGKTTSYAYDDADRLTSVTDAASPGNVTTYGYDTENNLTSIQDANGHTTSFNYDAFGRVTKTIFPSGYIETYSYDAVGNLQTKLDRKNQLLTYTYDQLNRLTQKAYPDTTAVNYTYDNDSRLTQVSDPTGTYQFTFDNMGRLTNTTTSYAFLAGRNFTTSYTYDAASNRTGFTDPESGSTSYVYDTLNRVQTLTPPAAFSATGNFGFTYDALSRRTQMTRPNGLKSIYAYDNLSHLLSVLHQSGSTTLDGAAYTVDNAGNRTSKTDELAAVTSNYTYDPIYELTQVTQATTTTESYSYDQVGNRLSSLGVSPYNVNTSNELTSTPSTTYTYDSNGNTQTKVVGSNTTSYAWDYENRMTSVTLPGTGGTVSFAYDPFGRRIKKVTSTTTSIFAYDGDNLIEETNSSGAVVARYEPTQNIDEPLAMLRSGATSYFHADGLGSVTSLSSAAGSIANTYTYDSFGKLTASTGSLVNPFQYTARESDTETGLYYYRARYYDSLVGRFISEDPRREVLRGMNFYAYVRNLPTNLIDPDGRTPVDWGKWGAALHWSYWARKIGGAIDWTLCEVYCLECRGSERRQDLDKAQGNGPGYTEDLLNQAQRTGSGDAGLNQYKTCTQGDPNCTKCLTCLAQQGAAKP
jgi:RHS repeat-associated protein